jgi:hypothetical protein
MAKPHRHQPGGSDRDDKRHHSGDDDHKLEHDKGNAEHIEIEERRFRGGRPPTPELYARAREQWNRLPGSVARPPMDPVPSKPSADSEATPEKGGKGEEGGGQ